MPENGRNPETEMEKLKMNDDLAQNKNVQKENHNENSQHPAALYFPNAARDRSSSHKKTTESSGSTVKGTTATPCRTFSTKWPSQVTSRTTMTSRPVSHSSMTTAPSKYAQQLLCTYVIEIIKIVDFLIIIG